MGEGGLYMRRPLSSRNRLFYYLSKALRQSWRFAEWHLDGKRYARQRQAEPLPFRVYKHQSVLVRRLGDADLQLQYNKVVNLGLALEHLEGILIGPGETFSFWRLVGRASKGRGYLPGMLLLNGEGRAGVGGGLCQIANLIHWLTLHSPLEVSEHHHHSFDPFPDSGRVLPFGSGATLYYNYLDYQLYNPTPHTFQLRFWMDSKCLNGDLRADTSLPVRYHVYEKNHAMLRIDGRFYRTNEIWRSRRPVAGGDGEHVLLRRNFAKVKYTPEHFEEVPPEDWGRYPTEG